MSRSLPAHAHLEHLKKQAKDLLRARRSGEPQAAARLRAHLKRLAPEAGAAAAPVSLQEAQFVIAREYGFTSWEQLLAEVTSAEADRLLSAIRAVHERLVTPLERLLARTLDREVVVSIDELARVAMGAYVESLGASCWNYCFRFDGRSGGHLALSLPLCAAILQPAADGEAVRQRVEEILASPTDPGYKTNDRCWPTNSDYHTIARLVIEMAVAIEAAWEVEPASGLSDIVLELLPSQIAIESPSDPGVGVRFEVACEGYEGMNLGLCYARSVVEPVLPS